MLVIRAGRHKACNTIANCETGWTLIRLLLQTESDLGLHCLSRPPWKVTSVPNFRVSTEKESKLEIKKIIEGHFSCTPDKFI